MCPRGTRSKRAHRGCDCRNESEKEKERKRSVHDPPRRKRFPTTRNVPGELDVLRHDGDAFRVDGAEVGVLEEADEVGYVLEEPREKGKE